MKIKQKETELKGAWNFVNHIIEADIVCHRIETLTKEYLIRIAVDSSGWEILYQDSADMRYWELTYPQSQLQGGGPPLLKNISEVDARNKYNVR